MYSYCTSAVRDFFCFPYNSVSDAGLFLFAEFVAALTCGGLGKRFTLDCSDDHMAMYKDHVGQAAAKRGYQCPEQEFADLHPGLLKFLSHKYSSFLIVSLIPASAQEKKQRFSAEPISGASAQ